MHEKRGYVPLWKVVIFFFLSAGLYMFPWYYNNRKYLLEKVKAPKNVLLDTIFLAIPLANLAFLYDQQSLTKDILEKKKKNISVQPPAIVGVTILLSLLTILANYLAILFFIIPLTMQKDQNETTETKEYEPTTMGEILSIGIGIIIWVALLA